MSAILKLCPKCLKSPATIQCIDCQEKMCFNCEQKVHANLRRHQTDIIPYSQMKQIKSAALIICGIQDQHSIIPQLQQELQELTELAEGKKSFIQHQQEKWSNQIDSLEQSYQEKLKHFETEIASSETDFKEFSKDENVFTTLSDIKQQMEAQKKQAWEELAQKKQQLNEKEAILKEMIQKEQSYASEIGKKEKLINQYKELLQQQQKEKELIKGENVKIKTQLESIKQLFKTKLPELGLSADFIDRLNDYENENNEDENNNEDDKEDEEDIDNKDNEGKQENNPEDIKEDQNQQDVKQ